jgi:formate dehydrogenase subunit delta
MDNTSLVRMANRIGDFFEAMPNRDAAMADITDHMRKFWVPAMRRQILEHIELHGGDGLSEIVLVALTRHRSALEVQLHTHSATSTDAAIASQVADAPTRSF